ncbi:aldo/keto reductase, partial [Kibdelosporangium lantanae]
MQQRHSYLRPAPGAEQGSTAGEELLHWLRAHDDVSLVAYSPILQGLYETDIPDVWSFYASSDAENRLAALAKVVADLGVTRSQVVLPWLVSK